MRLVITVFIVFCLVCHTNTRLYTQCYEEQKVFCLCAALFFFVFLSFLFKLGKWEHSGLKSWWCGVVCFFFVKSFLSFCKKFNKIKMVKIVTRRTNGWKMKQLICIRLVWVFVFFVDRLKTPISIVFWLN